MWNNALKIILLFLFPFGLYSEKENTVQVEWESIPGAISYRLEIKDSQEAIVYSEETTGTFLSIKLLVGDYSKRIVSIDKTGEEFPSQWTPLLVLSQKVQMNRIHLEWNNEENADYYILEIQNSNGNTVIRRKVKKTEIEVDLPFGKYKKRILTFDRTGEMVASDWTDLRILKKEDSNYDIVKRSAVFPGWGQVYSEWTYGTEGSRLRGHTFMILSSIFLGAFFYSAREAENQRNHFNQFATNKVFFSLAAGDSFFSIQDPYNLYVINQLIEKEQIYGRIADRANTSLGLFALVYMIQLTDAFHLQKYELPRFSFQTKTLGPESFYSMSAQFSF